MRPLLLCTFLALTGCDSYLSSQLHLTEQARKGLELCKQSQQESRAQIDAYQDLQRKRLDEAFDADVREQVDFTVDWIIEARKAYAAGLDAVAKQRSASLEAQQAQSRNLQAIDSALQLLQRIQQSQLDLLRAAKP